MNADPRHLQRPALLPESGPLAQGVPDPSARRIVERVIASGAPAPEAMTPEQGRQAFRDSRAALTHIAPPASLVRDITLRGAAGPIGARLYRGAACDAGALLPVWVFFHSGGWVAGDLETHDAVCRSIATLAHCAVVAVDYRLAPEHRFPAAVDDAWAALRHIASDGAALGLDTQRIAVGGDSAGGNLAAVAALMARDAGGPALLMQVLVYPATDFAGRHVSRERLGARPPLTGQTLDWFATQYLRSESDRTDWRASPLLAPDLAGVAPAMLVTCGCDPLEDEAIAYGRRLQAAGALLHYRRFPGQVHGFITMGGAIPETTILLGEIAAALDLAFDRAAAAQPDRRQAAPREAP
ncbi:MAG: alpha/beta hydrolase [Pseudomonadota bacterium]